jgi:branched-chain amino acid transport system ATP-binding protein
VLLDGRDLAGRRPELIRRAGIAIVPEGRRLLSELTVEDNIGTATYALSREQAQAGRGRALDLFPELSRRLSARARTLSGGEQQMLVLAQALVSQPRYILIDELSLGLAPVIVESLLPVVQRYARDSGCGVLLVEQHIQLALEVADRGYVLSHGEIVLHDRAEVLHADRELVVSSYLGEQQVSIAESAELSEGQTSTARKETA